MRIAIFSGRFDPAHTGHIITITKIAKKYDFVLVPILHYEGRKFEAEAIMKTLDFIFSELTPLNNIKFVVNHTHFGKITADEYSDFIVQNLGIVKDVDYLSGNPQVIVHFKSLGLRCKYIDRSLDHIYTATKIREGEI